MNDFTLNTIYFYLTTGCNLACRHCYLEPTPLKQATEKAVLAADVFSNIIKQAKPLGLRQVKLTGGEPLFHPQIKELLSIVKQEKVALRIETNGVLCSAELAEQISGCELYGKKPLVSVSLDSHEAKTHEYIRAVPGCFAETLQGIHNLVAAGIKPQIIMSLMEYNKNDVAAIVKLAEQLQASSVKFNIVQAMGRGEQLHDSNHALSIAEYIKMGKYVEQELATKTALKLIYGWPLAFSALSTMFNQDGLYGCGRCNLLNIIGVLADGSYAICGVGSHVQDLIFGTASTDDLAQVWNNSGVINELRSGLPDKLSGTCKCCMHKKHCLGSCVAHNYFESHDLFAPFWFCSQAEQAGLFPESRLTKKGDMAG